MNFFKLLGLSLLSGLLLFLSWTPAGFPFLIFFAFIPLFFVSDRLIEAGTKRSFAYGIAYSFPALLLWNVLTTWWIWNSTPPGAVVAFVLNSFFMSLMFGAWQWFRRQNPPAATLPVALVAFVMSWEFIHLNWDLSWSWLNLGNVFASCTPYVQWYEFTGVFGGTLWILVANFLLFYLIKSLRKRGKRRIIFATATAVWIAAPLILSAVMYHQYKRSDTAPIEAVIVQQNTDPWVEQYAMSNSDHAVRLLNVAMPELTEKTALLVCAESAIPHTIDELALRDRTYDPETSAYYGFLLFDSLLAHFPQLNLVFGSSTALLYPSKMTPTARPLGNSDQFIDMFNTAICMNRAGTQMYHKSKLVPGVEKMPFPKIFGFLENFVIDLGGPSGSLGTDSVQRAFAMVGGVKVGVPICYESVYGELFSGFVRDGAQVMAVITNDAWWGNTPGHRQHLLFSRLRAVETRRPILRAANTGISAVIDERGDIVQRTRYDERAVLQAHVSPNSTLTFYVQHGDYLGRIALFLAAAALLFGVVLRFFRRKRIRTY